MTAKLIRSLYNIKPAQQGGVVTIGNFDGVHLGHQALIERAVKKAKELGGKVTVMTFEPHPIELFTSDDVKVARLSRLREKFTALRDYGADYVLILPFDHALAGKTPSEFVKDILVDTLNTKHAVVGDDFHFGKKRAGNFDTLCELGEEYGFSAESMPTLKIDDERVSSTRVRQVLEKGNHELVDRLLGRPYSMQGRVVLGQQLGREWGYPTANIFLHRKLAPVNGIYTVMMHGVAEQPLPGVAYIGLRPTVNGTKALLEVHLLDFNQQIYGQYVEVEFCHKIREDQRFESVDLLKQQIAKDVAASREYFEKQGKL